MLKIGLVLTAILGGGFLAFPQLQSVIIGIVPFALFSLCPISMFFAMRGMNKDRGHHTGCASGECQNEKVTIKENNEHE